MALRICEESAILSLKTLLKNFPSGLLIEEVNRTFAKRFGTALDPLSYNHFTLKDFLQSVADKDKSLTIDNGKIKLCQMHRNEFSHEIEAVESAKAVGRKKKIGSVCHQRACLTNRLILIEKRHNGHLHVFSNVN